MTIEEMKKLDDKELLKLAETRNTRRPHTYTKEALKAQSVWNDRVHRSCGFSKSGTNPKIYDCNGADNR